MAPFVLIVASRHRMVERQAGGNPADCALLVGTAAGSAVAAAAPAGWQVLQIAAGAAAGESAPDVRHSAGPGRITQPVTSLHAVLHAVVSSHFPGEVIPKLVSNTGDGAEGTARLVVGHVMKLSREAALAQRGMLPLLPVDGVSFLPLRLDMPLEPQGLFHVVLHKVSLTIVRRVEAQHVAQ